MNSYRNGYSRGDGTAFINFINQAGSRASVYPVLLAPLGSNEEESYQNGYNLGKDCANTLRGIVPIYEAGNELDSFALKGSNYDGVRPSDYDNTNYTIARGLILGYIDGLRSIDSDTPIILNSISWLHFGFNDMLFAGTQPNGSSGHTIPKVQGTSYHWYSDMGDPTHATGGSGTYNVLAHAATWRIPIYLSEYGVRPSYGNEDQRGNYLVSDICMGKWADTASQYNIVHTAMYDLMDDVNLGSDGDYGVVEENGTTQKGRYPKVKSFVASHPMK